LIVDELGYVPFTAVGSELPFEVFSTAMISKRKRFGDFRGRLARAA
jgi:hypothetical protein